MVVLVLEVARLVSPQTGEGGRDRRGLQADRRDIVEIHGIGHDALSCHLDCNVVGLPAMTQTQAR
jgi:hypothetical protein